MAKKLFTNPQPATEEIAGTEPEYKPTREEMLQKQEHAKLLFTTNQTITQKEIAERVGVSQKTMSEWVKKFGWEKLALNLLLTRDNEYNNLLSQLAELNREINSREPGKRFPVKGEADTQKKLTASIRDLETDLSISENAQAFKDLVTFIKPEDPVFAKSLVNWADAFIKSKL